MIVSRHSLAEMILQSQRNLLKIIGPLAKEPYKRDFCKRDLYLQHLILQSQRNATLMMKNDYGVATISRLLNITGLFCKRAL